MLLFAILVLFSRAIKSEGVKGVLSFGAKLTYPIFLTHHWLIDRMVQGFFLAEMPRRYVLMMFAVYIAATLLISYGLMTLSERIVSRIRGKFKPAV